MMIVIAIIVMLAAVVGISLKGYLSKGNKASASIQSKRENFQSNNAAKNASFVAMGF
jgi:type II secretory pathway pseudopilin PulG